MKEINGGITSPVGFKSAGIEAGIKESGKRDMALICSNGPTAAAAVFTTNYMQAAPVKLSQEHLKDKAAEAIVINSGNANACTGEQGMIDAKKMTEIAARNLGIDLDKVLVASTGIIGKYLPMEKVKNGIDKLVPVLSETDRWAPEAILTTDDCKKEIAFSFYLPLQNTEVKIGGIAKGSGMIHPEMATMLSFITTDLAIKPELLQEALQEAVEVSFNRISVDGDQSTNDSVYLLANGKAGNKKIVNKDDDYKEFVKVLKKVATYLARSIVADGEGATKFITIKVKGAAIDREAEKMARKIANSPLVKTACFGKDPNWGRIAASAGASGVEFEANKLIIEINDKVLFKAGQPVNYEKEKLEGIMDKKEIEIIVNLQQGSGRAEFWTTDLSYEYIKVNAEYHT